ncbi:MAG: 30S ribosomal protein S6 [Kiritimatiellae bacterium]|nr:30S ribosomal protein S6 [Kiritimatiellia bacterium]
MKKYDGLYIFAGQAKDDVLESQIAKAVAEVTRLGGNILSQEVLGKRTFARPMAKRESGVYVQIRFELDPQKVGELVNRYRIVEEVFRVQILAVDERREAILAAQREAAEKRAAEKAQKEAEAAEAAPAE